MFKVGDKVKWTSQSQGYKSEKHGVVAAIIPAGKTVLSDAYTVRMPGQPRGHISYVIRVKNKHYWPLVSKLLPDTYDTSLRRVSVNVKDLEAIREDAIGIRKNHICSGEAIDYNRANKIVTAVDRMLN